VQEIVVRHTKKILKFLLFAREMVVLTFEWNLMKKALGLLGLRINTPSIP